MPQDKGHDFSDDELDAFDSRNEQILLDQAGSYAHANSSEDESEEEVLGLKHQNAEDSDDENGSSSGSENDSDGAEGSEDEDDERWGSKNEYYGGDDISEDEDANGMAEEALRQQRKHAQDLAMDDFVDEDIVEGWQKQTAKSEAPDAIFGGAVVEDKPVDFATLDDDEKLEYLNGSFPEFVPLLTEFNSLSSTLESLKKNKADALANTKYVALSAYLSSISSYVSIFVENLQKSPKFSMKDSPVMEAILSTREVWRQASEIHDFANQKEDSMDDSMDDFVDAQSEPSPTKLQISDDDRIQTDSESEEDDEDSEDSEDEQPESLDIDISAKRKIRTPAAFATGDYTESAAPDSIDKEEKDRRKKSLRFYTSKIDQAAKKNATLEKFDGDADLPYRERLFERQQRLVEEARKKGLGKDKAQLGEDLDGEEYGSGDEQVAQEINESAADYYEQIKQGKSASKDARRAAHESAKKAARMGKLGELAENVDEQGKRALNFQILKNKGLTPNRRNDNRNARVKKRKRYDQAQKKLKSVRQVYDQNNRGPYQGEKTGIKKNLSRSVRLQ